MSKKLANLDAHFIRIMVHGVCDPEPDHYYEQVYNIADAQCVVFQCPQCLNTDGHYVQCWFRERGVPDDETPGGRWIASGTGLSDLTLTPSVHLSGPGGCGWHGFVTDGRAK
jgi:hypothetical protein